MKNIEDSVFGSLSYNIYWERAYQLEFLAKKITAVLVVDGDKDADFEDAQFEAFKELELKKTGIIEQVENALFDYYQSSCNENRERLGNDADRLSPVISAPKDLDALVTLKQIVVMESFDSDERDIGFIFDTLWDPELGAGIKCTNGKIEDVGTQDVVL